jgi:hypothetical protein
MTGLFSIHAAVLEIARDLTIASQLKYVSESRAVYLDRVILDSLNLKHGITISEIVRTEINRMLNDYAANNPVYRFKSDELVALGVKVEVEGIGVVPDGVLLNLRILKFSRRKARL